MYVRWILAGMLLAALTGCLRRIEIVDIAPDGTITLTTLFEGDAEDVRTGYAMPTQAGGWSVDVQEDRDADPPKMRVVARRTVPAGRTIPPIYTDPASVTAPREPRSASALYIEKREDGTYYHFTRRYASRRWAQFDYHHAKLLESGEIRVLAEQDPKSLSDEQRAQLAERFIQVEALKNVELLNLAAASTTRTVSQESLVAAAQRVHAVYQDARVKADVIELLRGVEQGDAHAEVQRRLVVDARRAIEQALAAAGADTRAVNALLQSYDDVRGEYAITEDFGDEQWAVAVRMPGKIIACNTFDEQSQPTDTPASEGDFASVLIEGDDFPRGPDRCGWTFDGDAMYDREIGLMATSFVPADASK